MIRIDAGIVVRLGELLGAITRNIKNHTRKGYFLFIRHIPAPKRIRTPKMVKKGSSVILRVKR